MADAAAPGARTAVRYERLGATLVLVIDAPPVNALGHRLRQALWDAVAEAEADASVQSVVLAAEGRSFPAGADIGEFGQPPRAPSLPDLCTRIEDCTKPVVAAIHGTALGGGLELALAARARVARSDARMGFPEVNLGILPGAGGTQRAPRLMGAEAALGLMLSGRQVTAADAHAMGLVDLVADPEVLLETAVALAEVMAESPAPRTCDRTDGMRDPRAYGAAIAAAREQAQTAATDAPARIVDCVEAALLLPFAQGLEFERAAFQDLVGTDAAKALRQQFLAERRAAKGAGGVALPVSAVTVVGAGPDGADLVRSLLRAGLNVTLADVDQATLVPGLQRIAAEGEAEVGAGRMTEAARDEVWGRLSPALSDDAGTAPADAVILTGPFARPGIALPAVAGPRAAGAPLVTLGRIGAGDAQAVGLNLPPAGRLAEVLVGEATDLSTAATVAALARRIGRAPVTARGRGILTAMAAILATAAGHLAGRRGKTAVADVLAGWRMSVADLPEGPERAGDARGIAAALMAALANQGLRLLGEGLAFRPSDIDLVMVQGLGWPPHLPGPMLWAEGRGMLVLRADLAVLATEGADIWAPALLIDHLIREGLNLSSLDAT